MCNRFWPVVLTLLALLLPALAAEGAPLTEDQQRKIVADAMEAIRAADAQPREPASYAKQQALRSMLRGGPRVADAESLLLEELTGRDGLLIDREIGDVLRLLGPSEKQKIHDALAGRNVTPALELVVTAEFNALEKARADLVNSTDGMQRSYAANLIQGGDAATREDLDAALADSDHRVLVAGLKMAENFHLTGDEWDRVVELFRDPAPELQAQATATILLDVDHPHPDLDETAVARLSNHDAYMQAGTDWLKAHGIHKAETVTLLALAAVQMSGPARGAGIPSPLAAQTGLPMGGMTPTTAKRHMDHIELLLGLVQGNDGPVSVARRNLASARTAWANPTGRGPQRSGGGANPVIGPGGQNFPGNADSGEVGQIQTLMATDPNQACDLLARMLANPDDPEFTLLLRFVMSSDLAGAEHYGKLVEQVAHTAADLSTGQQLIALMALGQALHANPDVAARALWKAMQGSDGAKLWEMVTHDPPTLTVDNQGVFWTLVLREGNSEQRLRALKMLAGNPFLAGNSRFFDALGSAFTDKDPKVRNAVLLSREGLWPGAKVAPELLAMINSGLRDRDDAVRGTAFVLATQVPQDQVSADIAQGELHVLDTPGDSRLASWHILHDRSDLQKIFEKTPGYEAVYRRAVWDTDGKVQSMARDMNHGGELPPPPVTAKDICIFAALVAGCMLLVGFGVSGWRRGRRNVPETTGGVDPSLERAIRGGYFTGYALCLGSVAFFAVAMVLGEHVLDSEGMIPDATVALFPSAALAFFGAASAARSGKLRDWSVFAVLAAVVVLVSAVSLAMDAGQILSPLWYRYLASDYFVKNHMHVTLDLGAITRLVVDLALLIPSAVTLLALIRSLMRRPGGHGVAGPTLMKVPPLPFSLE